jgi:trehalose 6-phosphate phosphatase
VREATTSQGDGALAHAQVALGERKGVFLIPGHRVLEVTVRSTSKAEALRRLRDETGAATVVFAGDDVADEEAMATLGPGDVGIRVGREPSVARYRVSGPADVVAVLDALARQLDAG